MSREQANTFKKYREADDAQGNLAWAARLSQKALRQGPEAAARLDVEAEFELTDEEKVLWRLMKLPRRYVEIEHAGVLVTAKLRGVLRGLVAADVVDIVDVTDAKALLPAEVKRLKAEVAGKELKRSSEPLRGRVYRPDLDGGAAASASATPPSVPAPVAEVAPARPPPRAQTPVPTVVRLSDDDTRYKDEIERASSAAAKQNHYEFLGLGRPTDDGAVRAAYVRLAREYHPDRCASGPLAEDPIFRAKVEALFRRLGDAQAAVAHADSRSTYDRTLEALGDGPVDREGKKQRRPLEARNAFTMAETFYKKREYKQAEAHYRQAANFDGEDARILTALAWCIWNNPDHNENTRTAEARKRLTEVVTLHKHGDAAYKLGLMLRKMNDEGGAQRQFATAHRLDPEHVDAGREVRLAATRQAKAVQDKKDANSFLGKLGLKK